MSNSTPRACRPEISRLPAMKIARAAPTASTSAAIVYRSRRLFSVNACSSPVAVGRRWRACAEMRLPEVIETVSDHLYGFRKPSNRTNV